MLTLKALWAMFCEFISAFWERIGAPLLLIFMICGPMLSWEVYKSGYTVIAIVICVIPMLGQAAFMLFMIYLLAKEFMQSLNKKKKEIQRKENNPDRGGITEV